MELEIVAEKDLIEILGANKAAMYRLRKKGLPYISINRKARIYLVKDLMKFFEDNRTREDGEESQKE